MKIYVAGHGGMVGSAIVRQLVAQNYTPEQILLRSRSELNLTSQSEVAAFFAREKPDQVYMAAAKVGGIHANNTYPAEFIYENLMIQANIIQSAFLNGVKKLLFLGSSCIYPRNSPQPMQESDLLTGSLEPTNEPYAVAKIAGIKLCESYNRQYGGTHGVDYRSLMPTNLYGPGDNYHPENSHVIPALIRRFHEAKVNNADAVAIWGSGAPLREFLYVDDLARACIHVMKLEKSVYAAHTQSMLGHINAGYGSDISIRDLALAVKDVTGFKGSITFDSSKPDGAPRKLMSSDRLRSLGWSPTVSIEHGLALAYSDFLSNQCCVRSR